MTTIGAAQHFDYSRVKTSDLMSRYAVLYKAQRGTLPMVRHTQRSLLLITTRWFNQFYVKTDIKTALRSISINFLLEMS